MTTPDERRAALALMRNVTADFAADDGHVEEPDFVRWLQADAAAVAACATEDEIVAALEDAAWFDPTLEDDSRARAVAREYLAPI